jgi:hypothetical protein
MSLTRGVKANFPCPQCLIANEDQGKPSGCADSRTSDTMQVILAEAREQRPTERDKTLQSSGLRDVDVWFFFVHCLLSLIQYLIERVLENRELRSI